MAGSTINNERVSHILPILNEDRPADDEDKQGHIGKFVEGEEKWEEMVRRELREAIRRIESVGSVKSGYDPFVV